MTAATAMPDSPHHHAEIAAVATGTPNQQERYAAGFLPEDELLALARAELFKPFDGFKRWAKDTRLQAKDVRHDKTCEEHGAPTSAEPIVFETCQAIELSHDEWKIYRSIGEARDTADRHDWLAPGSVTIEPLAHFATCSVCQAEAVRMSTKVTVAWAGRRLVREYVLR